MPVSKYTLVTMLASMIGLTGCVDDKAGIHVTGILVPENEEGVCTSEPDGPVTTLTTWDLDVDTLAGPPRAFVLSLSLQNQLVERRSDIAVNPNGFDVKGLEVELLDVGGNRLDLGGLPNPYSMPATGSVPAGDETMPGRAAIAVAVIPGTYASVLPSNTTIVVSVRVFGETWGQQEIETDTWSFTVDTCRGCLIQCLPAGGTPAIPCTCGVGLPRDACTVICS